jgi:Fe-Mn family superoxide dismutase
MNSRHVLTRRDALKVLGAGVSLLGLGAITGRLNAGPMTAGSSATGQPFTLPKLGYAYTALEPHLDARTMEIHHTKHHQAYITNANKVLADYPALRELSAEAMVRGLEDIPAEIRTTLRNNVGGHLNHALFWQILSPQGGGAPGGALGQALDNSFGSFAAFQKQFADAAAKCFGSGWAWLSLKAGTLVVHSTANQDSPLMEGAVPLLGLDVWEHAYYLHYQNRRADYAAAFWQVVNWPQVEANYQAAGRA